MCCWPPHVKYTLYCELRLKTFESLDAKGSCLGGSSTRRTAGYPCPGGQFLEERGGGEGPAPERHASRSRVIAAASRAVWCVHQV